ncbi:hypothetical protein BV25DRAFT_1809299 [Artomyces pyxidatus]|uniref:Uncharacterized protein n=1 Tax=Artomyces pyxidatus TaxID=48021 RepID=A0ACB8SSU8_9AGAM|nr:hypothetical protein BV25DRAFT_1809299 [Artomyces pyxidatus]
MYVPRNTSALITIVGVNTDPDIWGAGAAEWKPERWRAPLPESIDAAHLPGIYAGMCTSESERLCPRMSRSYADHWLVDPEMALSQLVTSFRFTSSKKETVWRLGAIVPPSVKGSQAVGATMPIVVESI